MSKKLLIIKTFIDLLIERGSINEISIKEAADRAGIGKGTVYEYFQSKDDIVKHIIMHIFDMIGEVVLKYEGFDGLDFDRSIVHYVDDAVNKIKDLGPILKLPENMMPGKFKFSEIKETVFMKVNELQEINLRLFKQNVYEKGLREGKCETLTDYELLLVIKMITNETRELIGMQTTINKEAIVKMAHKMLKAD